MTPSSTRAQPQQLANSVELPDNIRSIVDAENVSDTRYFGLRTRTGRHQHGLRRAAGDLSYRDEHWRIDGQAQHYEPSTTHSRI